VGVPPGGGQCRSQEFEIGGGNMASASLQGGLGGGAWNQGIYTVLGGGGATAQPGYAPEGA
jgi:hypothetical protein